MGDDVNILYSVFKKRLSHLGIEHDEAIVASQPLEEESFQFAEAKALRIAMTNDVHIATEREKSQRDFLTTGYNDAAILLRAYLPADEEQGEDKEEAIEKRSVVPLVKPGGKNGCILIFGVGQLICQFFM